MTQPQTCPKPYLMTPARLASIERARAAKAARAKAEWDAAVSEAEGVKVLLAGIDTLNLSTSAELRLDVVHELKELRTKAVEVTVANRSARRIARRVGADLEDMEPKELPRWRSDVLGVDFEVQSYGTRKGLCLLVSEGLVLVVNPDGPRNLPRAYVELKASYLWSGWEAAADAACRLLASVTTGPSNVQVSRLDLSCDFMGWQPTPELLDEMTGRVMRRDPTYELEAGTRSKAFVRAHNVGRRFTGFSFGGGDLLCRLYDKTVEIQRSGKKWFVPLWQKAGYVDAETSGHVWRCEFQVRRDPLTHAELVTQDGALEMKSWVDVKQGLDALWRYLTREWLSYRLPRTATERCRFHPRWERLQAARFAAVPDAELYRHQLQYSLERNTGALAGYFKRELSLHYHARGTKPDRERFEADLREIIKTAQEHYALRHDSDLFDAATADWQRQLKWRDMFGRSQPGAA